MVEKLLKALGFPTDLDYPYVNIHTGYKSVSTLASQIGAYDDRHQWWSAVEHSRPVADLEKGIIIIDDAFTGIGRTAIGIHQS